MAPQSTRRRQFAPDCGFLEKFLGPLPGSASKQRVSGVGDPIRNHLNFLLNTRKGSIVHLPDYGMPDMASFYADYPSSVTGLRTAVEELVRKYEPRLENVQVRLIEAETGEFRVSLLITGELDEAEGGTRVTYRTTIHSEGHTELDAD